MFFTDDPIADHYRWEDEQQKIIDRLPECADCENPIQDETAYYINGEWICESCMDAYRREVLPE